MAELRKRAIAALQESTDLFEQAFALVEKGALKQAEQTQELARAKRTDSVWLMNAADKLENESKIPLV
jgi:hypothetical protein